MKKITLFSLLLTGIIGSALAQEIEHTLPGFDKIVVSPGINLILQQGDKESIKVIHSNINESNINFEVSHNKLHLYLYKSKWFERQEKYNVGECDFEREAYRHASVTAYVTYRELKKLVVRGEEEVTIADTLDVEKFKLKVYGEAEVRIASLTTDFFKAKLYGDNNLKINGGKIKEQKFKLYGGNKIDTRAVDSRTIASTIYGGGQLKVNASQWMSLTSFGEPRIQLNGDAHLHKGIVIGSPRIRTWQ